ncbi:hypothetical protein [Bacillus sp. ok061]|uniref:hypothetical protein n=1 Tax=Bacillus TaxID=1386 RepID=UPI00089F692E|nr:hypothetical protein [Bacillus sp. ok061]SEG78851.1 hypothetical protein SAMN04487919_12684 [Bacillus sp. ok061]
MKKTAIRLYNNKNGAHLIFHATPIYPKNAYEFYDHQWYITQNETVIGTPITGECYEMFIITTEIIKEKGYDGLYLYCKRTDIKTGKESNTEFIRLDSNLDKIIDSGTIFDAIKQYDEHGSITTNINQ